MEHLTTVLRKEFLEVPAHMLSDIWIYVNENVARINLQPHLVLDASQFSFLQGGMAARNPYVANYGRASLNLIPLHQMVMEAFPVFAFVFVTSERQRGVVIEFFLQLCTKCRVAYDE